MYSVKFIESLRVEMKLILCLFALMGISGLSLAGVLEKCKGSEAEACKRALEEETMHPHPKPSFATRSSGHPHEKTSEYWINLGHQHVQDKLSRRFNTNTAKNVVFFIGDGMSIPTLFATRVALGGEEQQLSFEKFPFSGLAKTYCVDAQVADSACTGTAYWTGVKTNYMTLGVNAKVPLGDCKAALDPSTHTESIAKWALDAGKSVGIVTTTTVTHASPGAGYAHVADRMWENDAIVRKSGCDPNEVSDIAHQLVHGPVGSRLSVVLGGGRGHLRDSSIPDEEGGFGFRSDSRDLISDWLNDGKPNKKYVWNRNDLLNLPTNTENLLGLFESGDMQFYLESQEKGTQNTEPTLEEMTRAAINVLKKNNKGFFLFVEGGRIDHGHHYTIPRAAIGEAIELHKAVQTAREMLSEDDSLIVVSSDHSHTMSISGYPTRGNDIFGKTDRGNAKDGMPYMTLSYANGPIQSNHYSTTGRVDPNTQDFSKWSSLYPFHVPLDMETHAGDDVGVFASGPFAHLFTSTMEQSHLPHLMAYAASIGKGPRS
ncbi:membrane-bound alkaline phosphatase-like [Phlebotomus argentipes]|uniref:membrane-bound alkaline phosphatase-like n=1 Tax=Phlebotomus argentipes TaxID=94469 RepID=UPI002892EBBC|nr:membrane-bound alkaline phosphatase-like [Phlebotomus argentipes]